jgi:hypothetical protein
MSYNPILPFGSWNHLVYTYDPIDGQSTSAFKVYINGTLTSSIYSNYNGDQSLNTQAGESLTFGSVIGQELIGKLDDIGIWNRALTQQEITGLYNATLNTSTAIENNEISIYPNPAKDRITIDCGNLANVTGYKVKIINMLGQEVYSGAINRQQVVVPINSWSGTGVYFVKIYDATNNLLHTKKIIVQ